MTVNDHQLLRYTTHVVFNSKYTIHVCFKERYIHISEYAISEDNILIAVWHRI